MDEKNVYIFTNIFHHWDLNRGPKRQYSLLEIEISATMDGKFQLFIHSKQKQFIFLLRPELSKQIIDEDKNARERRNNNKFCKK